MEIMTLSIQCFGAFRQFGDHLSVSITSGSSVLQIKEALIEQLGSEHHALVTESVLANDNEILSNAYMIQKEIALSILPPVCGG